jgi:two-component system phosphate regulon response regulator PhoB
MEATPGELERVLVVDDEPELVALVSYHLKNSGYRIMTAGDGAAAIAIATTDPPSIVVLDLMLPDMTGFEVLNALRAAPATRDVAVLMLTALREDTDRIRGLSMGADDYLTKPFNPEELVLRVAAILRRRSIGSSATDVTAFGDLEIDRSARRVSWRGRDLDLTPIEYRLLLLLVDFRGHAHERSHLLEAVWDAGPEMRTRTVDVHIQRLRAKLGPAGDMVETVRGYGYRFNARAAPMA